MSFCKVILICDVMYYPPNSRFYFCAGVSSNIHSCITFNASLHKQVPQKCGRKFLVMSEIVSNSTALMMGVR